MNRNLVKRRVQNLYRGCLRLFFAFLRRRHPGLLSFRSNQDPCKDVQAWIKDMKG